MAARTSSAITAALVATGVAALVAGPAIGSPTHGAHPTSSRAPSTHAQIAAAIRRSPLLGDVPASEVRVRQVVLAGRWASALVVPRDRRTDPAQVLLHRSASWRAVDLGTFGVGCGHVGTVLRHRLNLRGSC